MEIKIARSELVKGLGLLQGIVERKTTMPILTNALFDVSSKGLSITATDLEVGLNCLLHADVTAKGRVAIHARSIFDIVRALPDGVISIAVKDRNWVEIQSGKSKYKIVGLGAEEFPALPTKNEGATWKMDGGALVEMIGKASFAMSTDETRFNLNGVYLDPVKKGGGTTLRMIATDGHRLSIVERDAGSKCGVQKGVIIPRKGVMEIKKLIEGADSEVELWMDTKHLILFKDRVTLVVRLIEGQFPAYEPVVPKESKYTISVLRRSLIDALKRVSVLSVEKSLGVKLSISTKTMDIYASNPDIGEMREELEISYKGGAYEVCFNARYLVDALDVIEDDETVLQMGDETAPCVLRSEKDKGFTHVIMPMRL